MKRGCYSEFTLQSRFAFSGGAVCCLFYKSNSNKIREYQAVFALITFFEQEFSIGFLFFCCQLNWVPRCKCIFNFLRCLSERFYVSRVFGITPKISLLLRWRKFHIYSSLAPRLRTKLYTYIIHLYENYVNEEASF